MIKKTAIIIGASSDIGQAIAKEYAKNGYDLAVTYNSSEIDFCTIYEETKIQIPLISAEALYVLYSSICPRI